MRCAIGLTFLALLSCAGCRGKSALHELDPDLNRMLETPRYDPYEGNEFFDDGMNMRTPPEGSVPYQAPPPSTLYDAGGELDQPPMGISLSLLQRGRQNFERVCAACHGAMGDGHSVVATHMSRRPPSLHEPRIRALPLGKLRRIIAEGYGYMPAFAAHFSDEDIWAVASYVRALQLSQYATVERMPAELAQALREELEP